MRFDWRSYFKEFCRMHSPDGKYVLYQENPDTGKGGVWLFADGWKYHRYHMQGPEFPPPEDPEKHLKTIKEYWSIRLRAASEELRAAKEQLLDAVRLQQQRTALLQVAEVRTLEDLDGNPLVNEHGLPRKSVVSETVNFDHLLAMVKQYQDECTYCQNNLDSAIIPEPEPISFNPAEILAQLSKIEDSGAIKKHLNKFHR